METTTALIRNLICASLLLVGIAVHAQTNCVGQPAGLIDWWKADGNATDSIGNRNGTTSGTVVYAAGQVSNAFAFVNGNVNFGTTAANFNTGSFTVEFWLKTTAQVSENYQIAIMEKRPACNATLPYWSMRMGGTGTGGKLHIDMSSAAGQDGQSLLATRMLNDGAWHHVAFTRANGTISLYLDGALDAAQTNANTTYLSNGVAFVVGQSVCSCCDGTQIYSGYIDELSIYNRALGASEILSVYNAGTGGKCIDGTAPLITQQPASLTAMTNSLVGFTVVATGSAPLSYQWSFNSAPISGATNASFTISSVQLTDAGSYSVLVTNAFGSAQSSDAILTVTTQGGGGGGGGNTNCVTIPGLVNWWQAESNTLDSVGTSDGTASGGVSYAAGEVGQAFVFDGSGQITADTSTGNFRTNDFTVEFWFQTSSSDEMAFIAKRQVCDLDPSGWNIITGIFNGVDYGPGAIGFEMFSPDVVYSAAVPNVTANDGSWHHFALMRGGNVISMYFDGTLRTNITMDIPIDLNNSNPFQIGQNVCLFPYSGMMDEISIYNRALSAPEILSIYTAGTYGKCGSAGGSAPVITQQPVSLTAQTNSTVGFTVTATGSMPLSYQWSFNSATISGATNSSLTIANVQLANAGTYSVLVSNAFGSAQSSNATLTVTTGSGGGGGTSTNCATIPGLVNWWQAEGNALDSVGTNNGTTTSGVSYAAGKVGQSFNFNGSSGAVLIDSNAGNFRTNNFTIEFWMQTSSTATKMAVMEKRTGCDISFPGWSILFGENNGQVFPGRLGFELWTPAEVDATVATNSINDGAWHHIAWVRSNLTATMYIDGVSAASLTMGRQLDLNNPATLQFGRSVCGSSDGTGPFNGSLDEISFYNRALSASEIQTIYSAGSVGKCGGAGAAPRIFVQPTNILATFGNTVNAGVGASGAEPLGYNWIFNGTNVYFTTNSTLVITNVQPKDFGTYYVVVTNAYGSATSSNAALVFVPNVRLENAAQTIGPVTVPLRMIANGTENSVSVSVNFPATNLIYSSTTLGSNATGALLTVNTTQVASGKLGLAVFFADSSNFGIGTQELARITFRPGIVTNAVTNALTFGDVPVGRQVLDTNSNPLLVWYSNSVVTMPVTDYEGDVSPRTNGNHSMSIGDWQQAGRFVAGLDTVSNTLEFLRADCAPRTNGGDGRLSIADWVQAGRYGLGFDAIAPIGGTTNFTVAETPKLPTRPVSAALLSQNGLTNVVAVHLTAQGDENALGFSLSYNPAQLSFVSASLGSGASGSVMNVNSSQASNGSVGVALSMAPGGNFSAGDAEVVRVTFISSGFGSSYTANVGFGDQPILREIADANATTESASYSGTSFSATGQPLPQLTAVLDNVTNIVLFWPAPSTGFNLESTSPLGTNWTPVVYSPATNGGNIVVTQAISAGQMFYRLRHP